MGAHLQDELQESQKQTLQWLLSRHLQSTEDRHTTLPAKRSTECCRASQGRLVLVGVQMRHAHLALDGHLDLVIADIALQTLAGGLIAPEQGCQRAQHQLAELQALTALVLKIEQIHNLHKTLC